MLAALVAAFVLTSPAFPPGGTIPAAFTCDGRNVSPPLAWTAPPGRTRSLALSVVDVDAAGFAHWLGWNVPASARRLAEGARPPAEGRNDFGKPGYGGPCPPPGSGAHRYVFTVYALSAGLRLPAGAPFSLFRRALAGHVLASAALTGRYGR